MPTDITSIVESFTDRSATVGVVGLGYVGLPLALTLVEKGFKVLGLDIDPAKVEKLMAGKSYVSHIQNQSIKTLVGKGGLEPTTDFSRCGEADAILICVPTPLTKSREPDLSYVIETVEKIEAFLTPGQLIVLESTTYPGTCRELLRPVLEKNGMKSGKDFFLAYSPEREDPGNLDFSTSTIPKIVGGDDAAALKLAQSLYDQVVVETVPVNNMDVAEAVKLTENIFRSVNIALVNELKVIYDKMGIDIWEIIEAAKTKPFGYMPFYPGPGLGGHCIPIDPFYLTWRAKQFGQNTRFIELAGEINTAMPNYVVSNLEGALNERFGRGLRGAKILIIGLSYKKNINDIRESPALVLIELLEARGASVSYYDPYVPEIPITRDHDSLAGRQSIEWEMDRLADFDATLICTDHDNIAYADLISESKLVVDTRNVLGLGSGQIGNLVKS